MMIGYARVSTTDQDLSLQLDALHKAGCSRVFEERLSGRGMDRPELTRCLDTLRVGDTLAVWRLDRLGRSIRDLIDIVQQLEKAGIQFVSLTEEINTRTATGKLTFHIFASIAEFERNLIRERTNAGLMAARARGKVGGAPPKTSVKQDQAMLTLWESNEQSASEIAKTYNISVATFFRRMAKAKAARLQVSL